MAKCRLFTPRFKARVALEALREDRTAQQIATRYGMHPNQASQCKRKLREGLQKVFERGGTGKGRRRPRCPRCTRRSGSGGLAGFLKSRTCSLSVEQLKSFGRSVEQPEDRQ